MVIQGAGKGDWSADRGPDRNRSLGCCHCTETIKLDRVAGPGAGEAACPVVGPDSKNRRAKKVARLGT
uniref:Uncharacterized protein n=1 Tax=Pristionchus pacificus TaxID=54126 RepID=A0A2A6CMF1_PRIPA|eukprot:PDM79278.1 hypothetical protein PRIPAC_31857 [Pristionchus pacificus]